TVVGVSTAAVASVALGVYFALQSQSEKSTSDAFRASYREGGCFRTPGSTPCTQWNDAVQAQSRDAALSNGFYIGGGVLAAAAVATWFLWPEDHRRARAAVLTPSLGPTGAGFIAAGRF
ncbi:MAG: hypothetical protein JOZ69_06730, partial [Myxococcales bacterium]|nr:hypothetical protein [Myxococcales bacterium]